jgi:hypothetical protein
MIGFVSTPRKPAARASSPVASSAPSATAIRGSCRGLPRSLSPKQCRSPELDPQLRTATEEECASERQDEPSISHATRKVCLFRRRDRSLDATCFHRLDLQRQRICGQTGDDRGSTREFQAD